MTRKARRSGEPLDNPIAVLVLSAIALLDAVQRIVDVFLNGAEVQVNTANVWRPMAEGVLNGGDLYVVHWDNKPPLFQFLNLSVAFTDHYLVTFYLLVGAANAVTAVLVWKLCSTHGRSRMGLVAAVMFLGFGVFANASQIDPRPFANVLMVFAFLTANPILAGASISAGGLMSQFTTFVIPVLAWYHLSQLSVADSKRWVAQFALSGIAIVAASFGIVFLLWGTESTVLGFRYSFLPLSDYVSGYVDRGLTVAGNPVGWTYYEALTLRKYLFLYLAGGYAVYAFGRSPPSRIRRLYYASIAGVLLLSVPRLIRHGAVYNLPPLVFLSVLSAIGVFTFVQGRNASN